MIRKYDDMSITVVRATANPASIVKLASDITQKHILEDALAITPASRKLHKFLLKADHTSIFEHGSITVLISGVSRSFMAQITRHRIASYTIASQHYQDYRGYDDIVSPRMARDEFCAAILTDATKHYEHLLAADYPPEEARQILPEAKAVNILWTINGRSLVNYLTARLCRRNVGEMYAFAKLLHRITIDWWPELFVYVGPPCQRFGGCTQGWMQAQVCKDEGIKQI